jgi:hypothetical protein
MNLYEWFAALGICYLALRALCQLYVVYFMSVEQNRLKKIINSQKDLMDFQRNIKGRMAQKHRLMEDTLEKSVIYAKDCAEESASLLAFIHYLVKEFGETIDYQMFITETTGISFTVTLILENYFAAFEFPNDFREMFSDLPMANMNTGDKTKRKLAEILKETKA